MSQQETARIGRPPKVDSDGVSTRERLLRSAVEAYADHGFDGVTLAEIASRADVSTPAIYNHFRDRAHLLVEASRAAIDEFDARSEADRDTMDLNHSVQRWTRDSTSAARRMIVELHIVGMRNDEIRETLAEWHQQNFGRLVDNGHKPAKIKASYVLLLGLAMLDTLDDLDVDDDEVMAEISKMVDGMGPLTDPD